MKKCLVLLVFVVGLFGCDVDQTHERSLNPAWVAMPDQFDFETFELSMIKLHYMDESGVEHLIDLTEDMVVGELDIREGNNTIIAQYEGLQVEMSFHFNFPQDVHCRVDYSAIDSIRGWGLNYNQYVEESVGSTVGECIVRYYDAPAIEGYTFSHFDPAIGSAFNQGSTQNVTMYYDPIQYAINIYDYRGEIVETLDALYGANISDYRYPFPSYFYFNSWDQDLSNIEGPLDVHPQGFLQSYNVTFLDHDDEFHAVIGVDHGDSLDPPEGPLREGYTFIEWDHSLEDITMNITVKPIYERDLQIGDIIDDVTMAGNYTVDIEWENIPYGEGNVINTYKIDDHKAELHIWNVHFYLFTEENTLMSLTKHDYDDYKDWHKYYYDGETVAQMIIIDWMNITHDMLSYHGTYFTLDNTHYETIFGNDYIDVEGVTINLTVDTISIDIDWVNDVTSSMLVYDINQTSVIIPEYIDET